VYLIDAQTLDVIRTIEASAPLTSVAFSPDDEFIVATPERGDVLRKKK
jgi:hypothetical protein